MSVEDSRENAFDPSSDTPIWLHDHAGQESWKTRQAGIFEAEGEVPAGKIIEHMSMGVIVISSDGVVRAFNRAAEHMFGYPAEEVIGGPVTIVIPQRLRAAHSAGLRRYLESSVPTIVGHAVRLPGLRRDGEEIMLELVIFVVNHDGRYFIGLVKELGTGAVEGS